MLLQTNELVKRFHDCLKNREEYEEKEWDSLMELPPRGRRQSFGPGSQNSPSKPAYASFSYQHHFGTRLLDSLEALFHIEVCLRQTEACQGS